MKKSEIHVFYGLAFSCRTVDTKQFHVPLYLEDISGVCSRTLTGIVDPFFQHSISHTTHTTTTAVVYLVAHYH